MIFNIPRDQWIRVQDSTSDIVYCGYFDTTSIEKELKYIKVGFFKQNCIGTFRIRLHTTASRNRNYSISSLVDFSLIAEPLFTGQIRFDFTNTILVAATRYWVTIEAISYTRISDTNFIGWVHDFPFPTNVSTGNWQKDFPIKMEVFAK